VSSHENKAVEPEMNNEVSIEKRRELLDEELMAWNIKALPHTTFEMDIGMAIGAMFPLGMMLYGYFGEHGNGFFQSVGTFGVCFFYFLWKKVVRQKNVYQYRITDQGGEVRYWADYPKHFGTFFKCVSGLFLFVVICMIAVSPAFIWLLAGAGGMALAGARFFFGWENEIRTGRFTWDRVNRVVIDNKRKMVVMTRHDDPNLSFEENYLCFEAFLTQQQIDKFVDMVKQYAPKTTDFEEGRWVE
jgi:hypothetical protein